VVWSVAVALIVGVCIFSFNFLLPDGSIVRSDGLVYFLYARSIVVDGDADLTPEFPEVQTRFSATPYVTGALFTYSRRLPDTGKITVPWPIGIGIVMAPFYASGYAVEYVVATIGHRSPDTYGAVPQYFYASGSVLFGMLAFWTGFACCERVSTLRSAYLASLATLLAGPAVCYIFFSPSMAHAPSLGLVGLLTWRWLDCWQTRTRGVFWLGLLVGTITCIRYQNVIFGIMVLTLIARDARREGPSVGVREALLAACGALIPLSVQAAHYISLNGWSLGHRAGTGFMLLDHARVELTRPQFTAVLFSCDKGAFYWAPIMAIGCLGLLYAARRHAWARVMLAIFVAQVLLISVIRNHGDRLDMQTSFGMRYLTECSIGLAMGVATLVARARSLRAWRSWVIVGALLSTWNLLLIMAYVLTIPRSGCVTYPQMADGMARAILQVVTAIRGL